MERGRKETNLVEELPSSLPSSSSSSSLLLLPGENLKEEGTLREGLPLVDFFPLKRSPAQNALISPFMEKNQESSGDGLWQKSWASASRYSGMELMLQCGENRKLLEE